MSFLNLFSKKEKIEDNKVEENNTLNYVKQDNNFLAILKEQVVESKQSKNEVETAIREGDGLGFNSKISS